MAQTYTIDCYGAAHGGQADLLLMEQNFESLRTTFSGAVAPANTAAGTVWFDTAKKLFKIRNDADSAWLGVLAGTTSLKMLVYRNTAEDGWAIDGGVTDRVVAIKGGATYTTGAATAGSWTLPDYTLLAADIPGHTHTGTTATEGAHTHTDTMGTTTGSGTNAAEAPNAGGGTLTTDAGSAHSHTFTSASTGGSGAHNHGATYRPAAAVVTIQYPDI